MKSMKKLGVLFASLALISAAQAADVNWVPVGIAQDGTYYYLDMNNVQEGKDFAVNYWAKKSNDPQMQFDSVVAHLKGNCATRDVVWAESQTAFNKLGQPVAKDQQIREMRVVVGTGDKKLIDEACEVIHRRYMK